jgi:hypothetical protein
MLVDEIAEGVQQHARRARRGAIVRYHTAAPAEARGNTNPAGVKIA